MRQFNCRGPYTSARKGEPPVQAAAMKITQNLSQVWRKSVNAGHVRAKLEQADGRLGWWGVEEDQQGTLTFYLEDQHCCRARADVKTRAIAKGFWLQYHPFREYRPGFKKPAPGRQPDLTSEPWTCAFGCQDP